MRVCFKVNLKTPVSGRVIAEAVKKIAGGEYHQEEIGEVYEIGQASAYPYKDLLIGVGCPQITQLRMDEDYTAVFVVSYQHGGVKFLIGYDDDKIRECLSAFRDRLQEALS